MIITIYNYVCTVCIYTYICATAHMKDFLRTRGILRYGGPKFNCYRGFFNELRAKEMGVEGACAINPAYVIMETIQLDIA